MRKYMILIPALGVAVCLAGAALMAFRAGLLGENHTGIATVKGIVGIGLIGLGGALYSSQEAKSRTGGV